ncbi:MAG: sigma-70 family RNA polymerase sigma factor [Planctomycetota bacterium]|nr:sigma-70 family RNA polymerase sigma factor [Planctomycetota bacterium]
MPNPALNDSQLDDLVNKVIHGDRNALALVFEHYRDRLRKIVSFRLDHRVASRVDVEDVLQESYLNAEQRLQHVWREANTGGLFVWLRLIVQQTIADVHRRHLTAQSRDASRDRPLDAPPGGMSSASSMASWLLGHMTSPSQAAVRKEVSAQLETALNTLSELDREILMLRHVEELSNVEASAILGLSEQGASARYVRALTRLQQIVARIPGLADRQTPG